MSQHIQQSSRLTRFYSDQLQTRRLIQITFSTSFTPLQVLLYTYVSKSRICHQVPAGSTQLLYVIITTKYETRHCLQYFALVLDTVIRLLVYVWL